VDALVIPATGPDSSWRLHPSKFGVVKAVTRRLVPYLIEATLIPTCIFYVVLATLELRWALLAALGWTYVSLGRRLVTRQRVPGLLILATLGITTRVTIFLLNDNVFILFLQPILRTLVTGVFFALSVVFGRPLIARFAADFCPLTADVQNRPAVVSLFRRLTYVWAGVNAVAAATSLTLLLTVPFAVFVGTATLAAWIITCSGVVWTVSDSVGTARNEGLATAVTPNGTLRAYAAA
jgi:hypothetical protein